MMQLHLDEISRNGARAVLLLDRAGWHTTTKLEVPDNIMPIFLPSRAPELKPVENVCHISARTGSQTLSFVNYDAITDAACAAWRNLTAKPETTSIGMRDWPHVEKPIPRTRILCARCFITLGLRPSQNHKGPGVGFGCEPPD